MESKGKWFLSCLERPLHVLLGACFGDVLSMFPGQRRFMLVFLSCASILSGLTPILISAANCFVFWVSLSALALVILNPKRKVGSDLRVHTDFRLMIDNAILHQQIIDGSGEVEIHVSRGKKRKGRYFIELEGETDE